MATDSAIKMSTFVSTVLSFTVSESLVIMLRRVIRLWTEKTGLQAGLQGTDANRLLKRPSEDGPLD